MDNLPGINFMPEAPWGRHTRWLAVITVDPSQFGADREAVRLALEAENIASNVPSVSFMHLQPVFLAPGLVLSSIEGLGGQGALCLPSGCNLTEGDLARVVEVIRRVQGQTHL